MWGSGRKGGFGSDERGLIAPLLLLCGAMPAGVGFLIVLGGVPEPDGFRLILAANGFQMAEAGYVERSDERS